MTEGVKQSAEKQVEERLLDNLLPEPAGGLDEEAEERRGRTRERMRGQLQDGSIEGREIEIGVEQRASVVGMLGNPGMEMDVEMQGMIEKMIPTRRETRRLTVAEARKVLFAQEAEKLIDKNKINETAIARVEQGGIVFLDELDKVASGGKEHGPDVSRQGVQRDLLPIVEGSTVITKYGPVKTDHVLFIAAGAFHTSKPSDLMPELQGRFPIRVELSDLTVEDFVRILREPKNSLTAQQVQLLATEGLEVSFADDAIDQMARTAYDVNRRSQNIGARRLYTIMERVFEEVSFDADSRAEKKVVIDAEYVRSRVSAVAKDEDLSKFIL